MGTPRKFGTCRVCYEYMPMKTKHFMPTHTNSLTGERCHGSGGAPEGETPPVDNTKRDAETGLPLASSKQDYEVSLKWNRGQPGTGKRR